MKLYVDGKAKPFSYSKATDKLTYTSTRLSLGKHTVKIAATDSSKAVGARAWSFTVVRR